MDEPTTPDAAVDGSDAPDTPVTEPVEAPIAEAGADQSAAPGTQIGQAEYTRATQTAALVRKELGLPKSASQKEVAAAIAALKAGPAPTEDAGEDEDEDPRLTAERDRRIAAELRVQSAVYGEEFTDDAIALMNLARTSDDYEEIITAMAAFRDRHGAEVQAAADDEGEPQDDAPPAAELSIGTSEGDRAPSLPTTSAPSGRQESGTIAAIRGLFKDAGVASRPDN